MDQIRDKSHAGLYAISKVCELPDFVKTASKERDIEGVSSEHFGDRSKRMYPLHTKEDTWLSWAYFSNFGDGNEKTAANIKHMAKFWKVDLPRFETKEKEASESVMIKYAFEDQVHHETEVTSAEDLNKIAKDLRDNASNYPYDMRMNVAKQVLSAARKFHVELPYDTSQSLHKMAGYGVGTVTGALQVLEDRLNVCKRYGLTDRLDDLRDVMRKAASNGLLPQPLLIKIARFSDVVDRMSKQHKRYGHDFIRPEESLFSITLKDMDEVEKRAGQLRDGTFVTERQVRNPEVRKMVTNFIGEKVAYDDLFEAVKQLDPAKAKLVSRVLG